MTKLTDGWLPFHLDINEDTLNKALQKLREARALYSTTIEAPTGMTKDEIKQFIKSRAKDD